MSTHNLYFRAKIRINVYPCKPQFYYIKVGCKGVYITWTCYPDAIMLTSHLNKTPLHPTLYSKTGFTGVINITLTLFFL